MELAQLLITPGTLLTAFIFFWRQAKASSDDLKRELKSDMQELKREMKEDLKQVQTNSDDLKRELKSDMKAMNEELKEEITSVRREVTTVQIEMHDMNGRLGRVEGLLMAPDVGDS